MKRSILLILTLTAFLFSGCLRNLEKEGINPETVYKGRVIDAQGNPLSGIMIRITNDQVIYNSVTTDYDGLFLLKVDMSKIDDNYYVLIGDIKGEHRRGKLRGFGQDVYDYGDIPFVNINIPQIGATELMDVSFNSFTCQCEVASKGGSTVTERGVCWSSSVPTIKDNVVKCGVGEGVYSCYISDDTFDFNTITIYARAYAINEYGETYGDLIEINQVQLNKFMKIKLPTVETIGLTAMTSNSFTCKCNVISQGKAIVTERGICWSTNIPTIQDNKVLFGGGEGVYSCTVTGLDFGSTTYYARAYAINEYGESYGEPVEVNSSRVAYFSLPTMDFGGYTYHIHPDMGGMQWIQGEEACNNLVAYGFDDWFMPNKEEMLAIAKIENVLDKVIRYWTSSDAGSPYYYFVYYNYGWDTSDAGRSNVYHIVPVRRDR